MNKKRVAGELVAVAKILTAQDARTWRVLLEDLTDVNNHSFVSDLEEALEEAGIL